MRVLTSSNGLQTHAPSEPLTKPATSRVEIGVGPTCPFTSLMYVQIGSNKPILNKFFDPSRKSPGTSLRECIRCTLCSRQYITK